MAEEILASRVQFGDVIVTDHEPWVEYFHGVLDGTEPVLVVQKRTLNFVKDPSLFQRLHHHPFFPTLVGTLRIGNKVCGVLAVPKGLEHASRIPYVSKFEFGYPVDFHSTALSQITWFMEDVLGGLVHAHSLGVVLHLGSKNLSIVDTEGRFRVLMHTLEAAKEESPPPPYHFSPDWILINSEANLNTCASDMFRFGIMTCRVVMETLGRVKAFYAVETPRKILNIVQSALRLLEPLSPSLHRILQGCCERHPDARLTAEAALDLLLSSPRDWAIPLFSELAAAPTPTPTSLTELACFKSNLSLLDHFVFHVGKHRMRRFLDAGTWTQPVRSFHENVACLADVIVAVISSEPSLRHVILHAGTDVSVIARLCNEELFADREDAPCLERLCRQRVFEGLCRVRVFPTNPGPFCVTFRALLEATIPIPPDLRVALLFRERTWPLHNTVVDGVDEEEEIRRVRGQEWQLTSSPVDFLSRGGYVRVCSCYAQMKEYYLCVDGLDVGTVRFTSISLGEEDNDGPCGSDDPLVTIPEDKLSPPMSPLSFLIQELGIKPHGSEQIFVPTRGLRFAWLVCVLGRVSVRNA